VPIDSSIYFQQQAPDIVGSIERGLNMRQLIDQRRKQRDVEDAYKAGVVTNPDGSTTFDNTKTMSALAKADPKQAMEFQRESQTLEAQKQKLQQEKHMHAIDMFARIAPSMKDQASYEAGLQTLTKAGVDVSDAPRAYEPSLVDRYHSMALTAKEQREFLDKDRHAATEQQGADAKTLEARASAANAGLPFSQTAGIKGVKPPVRSPLASSSQKKNLVANNGPGGAMGRVEQLLDQDPAELLANVPAKDRDKVAAEIDAAKNAAQNGPKILNAFDNAYGQHLVDYIPGTLNVDQKNFHALLGPTFKDVEGTVRQAAMDNMFSNTTPQFGDSKRSREIKRNATKDYLQYKGASSLAKNYGIDLSKYKSTNVEAALNAINSKEKGAPAPVLKTHEIEWAD
jgi:hypothetical protein